MNDVIGELVRLAADRGFAVKVCSAGHLDELREEIASRLGSGEVDRAFAAERLARFDFSPLIEGRPANSLIVAAAPQPTLLTRFDYRGKQFQYPIPPTYTEGTDEDLAGVLDEVLRPRGHTFVPARLPYKLLAARTGLTRYGRNNIAYHPAFGSYFRLQGYLSDLPATTDDWTEETWLAECASCAACVRACPTGAVTLEQTIVRAERCLTYHNESPEDFPGWIKPEWHTCLVGCLRCQTACPADRDLGLPTPEPVGFTEAETENFLAAHQTNELTPGVHDKLEALWFLDGWEIIQRNLRVLLERDAS